MVGAGGSRWGIWVSTFLSVGDASQVRFPLHIVCRVQALSLSGVFLCHVFKIRRFLDNMGLLSTSDLLKAALI